MNEAARLAALNSLDILDTASEETFDRLTQLAAKALQAPIALASLVDAARIWVKAKVGPAGSEVTRQGAFCSETIMVDDVLIVEDARRDTRFNSSALVTEAGIRFYAGAPVSLATGEVVGALCVLDTAARPAPSAEGQALLKGLAAAAGHLLDLRRELIARRATERRLAEHARLLEMAEDIAGIGTWRLDFNSGDLQLSPAIFAIYGLDASRGMPDADALLAMYDPPDRAKIVASIEEARATGRGYAFDARMRRLDGNWRDVAAKARVEVDAAGQPMALIGVLQDVTVERSAMAILVGERAEAERRANRMRDLATTDILTGLPNRRTLLDQVAEAFERGRHFSLAIIDIDHFKSINDRYGHDGGDLTLAAFGKLCAHFAEGCLCLSRIGGEEFAMIVEDASGGAAAAAVERLRRAMLSNPVLLPMGVELRLTFSAGIASAQPGDDWTSLFKRADEALYRAKSEGRDRTAMAA